MKMKVQNRNYENRMIYIDINISFKALTWTRQNKRDTSSVLRKTISRAIARWCPISDIEFYQDWCPQDIVEILGKKNWMVTLSFVKCSNNNVVVNFLFQWIFVFPFLKKFISIHYLTPQKLWKIKINWTKKLTTTTIITHLPLFSW